MRDYGKVSPHFWLRGSGKKLRGDSEAQVVALYLATSPSANITGLYHIERARLAQRSAQNRGRGPGKEGLRGAGGGSRFGVHEST